MWVCMGYHTDFITPEGQSWSIISCTYLLLQWTTYQQRANPLDNSIMAAHLRAVKLAVWMCTHPYSISRHKGQFIIVPRIKLIQALVLLETWSFCITTCKQISNLLTWLPLFIHWTLLVWTPVMISNLDNRAPTAVILVRYCTYIVKPP